MMDKLSKYFDFNTLSNKILDVLLNEFSDIILIIILYFLISRLFNKIIATLLNRLSRRYEDAGDLESKKRMMTIGLLFKATVRITLISILLMILLSELGLDIAPLIASAGIIGLAIGFGAQELVRDVISGLFIILEDKIRVGDVVSINGTRGLVEKLEIRTVSLRDTSGTVHIFQNGKINSISNMTKEWSAMIFNIGVAYKEDIDHVIKIIQQVGDLLYQDEDFSNHMISSVEIQGVNDFGDNAIMIGARIKTHPGRQWIIGREFRKRIKNAFDAEGIEIPFPHRTIYWGEKINPLILKNDSSDLRRQVSLD